MNFKNHLPKAPSVKNIPLSWTMDSNPLPKINFVKLYNNAKWLSLANFPYNYNSSSILTDAANNYGNKIIIRGCDLEIANYLEKKGFARLHTGMEAVLELDKDYFKKKSLKELVKRGFKHGKVIELEYSKENAEKIEQFKKCTTHYSEPRLKYLYILNFIPGTKVFVFESHSGKWLGAIQVSINSKTKLQTELLLRRKYAQVGIMEALIYFTFISLRKTKYKEWSLGEVPFVFNEKKFNFLSKAYLINKVGQAFKFAYNYEGLYNFKNKFNPRWDDIYICGRPKIAYTYLFLLFIKSNLYKLIFYRLGTTLGNIFGVKNNRLL